MACVNKNCCTCVDSADCDSKRSEKEQRRFDNQNRYNIENNITALESYIVSMNCAIEKAKNGSTCEKMYFVEKLERMCNRLGFDLVKK
jgi:hypothetical protein